MITINNNIDAEYKARIYYKNKLIGECLNELAFLDARLQIAIEESADYTFELVKVKNNIEEVSPKYRIAKNGKYIDQVDWKLYWPSSDSILSRLLQI